ncbi:hypothetical protein IAG41_09825 [Sphingomonas sp. JC676]|uniref:PGN_0703 family putative restriction endonuclease n=1 Tax=Sphingomonas sp. JC676 TaxID=2768065 RepID=UPI0016583694|nr:hypothetical protein [Sphingomonas sp. JC676]MBC9032690.1 hypothetical protein [Sphingomonas sp. JC676]
MSIVLSVTPPPIVPNSILRQHHAYEPSDTRFRACARLLQSIWRQQQGLEAGRHTTRRGGKRLVGSLLTTADAEVGCNFLSQDLFRLARLSVAYRQPGALIHAKRLIANALSSHPLAFNLFGPLALDHVLAARVLRLLLPQLPIADVRAIAFEFSPGRGAAELTGDGTAYDIAVSYERHDGAPAFVGIELKYSEGMGEAASNNVARYDDLAEASALYREPASALLQLPSIRQLVREHLLTQAALIRGDFAQADFVLIAPQHNDAVARAADLYQAQLNPCLPGHVPFAFLSLEQVIAAIDHAGARDHAHALHQRYTDWSAIDRLVGDFIDRRPPAETQGRSQPRFLQRHRHQSGRNSSRCDTSKVSAIS